MKGGYCKYCNDYFRHVGTKTSHEIHCPQRPMGRKRRTGKIDRDMHIPDRRD